MFSLRHFQMCVPVTVALCNCIDPSTLPTPRPTMVRCTCPIRCKGGRDVTERTRSKHEKELRDKEHEELIRKYFPERFTSLPDPPRRRRRRANDNDTQETCRKKARMTSGQGGSMEIQSVRVSMNFTGLRLMSQQPARSQRRREYHRYAKR